MTSDVNPAKASRTQAATAQRVNVADTAVNNGKTAENNGSSSKRGSQLLDTNTAFEYFPGITKRNDSSLPSDLTPKQKITGLLVMNQTTGISKGIRNSTSLSEELSNIVLNSFGYLDSCINSDGGLRTDNLDFLDTTAKTDDEQRINNIKLCSTSPIPGKDDFERYLAIYRSKLRFEGYKIFLARLSDELSKNPSGLESALSALSELITNTKPTPPISLSPEQKATIGTTEKVMSILEKHSDLESLLTKRGKALFDELRDSQTRGNLLDDSILELTKEIKLSGPKKFKESLDLISQLNLIGELSARNSQLRGNWPNLICSGLDELIRRYEEKTPYKVLESGTPVDIAISRAIEKTLNDVNETMNLEKEKVTALFSKSGGGRSSASSDQSLQTSPRLPNPATTAVAKSRKQHQNQGTAPEDIKATPQATPEPAFPAFDAGSPSVIASRKASKPAKPSSVGNRRWFLGITGAVTAVTAVEAIVYGTGSLWHSTPEQNTVPVAQGGNGGAAGVGQVTETTEADKKKADLIEKIVPLKTKFRTYTDTEDQEQVSKVYLKHGMNVTTATEAELKKLSEEALRDIYVESLDASCRVEAKGELAELKKQYPVEGFDLTKPEEREKLKINLNNVYFNLLYLYLARFPSDGYLKDNFSKCLKSFEKVKVPDDATYKSDWDKFKTIAQKFATGSNSVEELTASACKLPEKVLRWIPLIKDLYIKHKSQNNMLADTTGIPSDVSKNLSNIQLRNIFSEKEYNEVFNAGLPIDSLIGWSCFGPSYVPSYSHVALASYKDGNTLTCDEPAFATQRFQQEVSDQYQALEDRIKKYKETHMKNSKKDLNTTTSELLAAERCLLRLKEIIVLTEKKYKEIN